MNIARFLRKNGFAVVAILLVLLAIFLYSKNVNGFSNICNASNCRGDYEWVGGKCLVKCDKVWRGSSILRANSLFCKNTGYGTNNQVISRANRGLEKYNC